ncbi:putative Alpha-soluble NSF attachment protein [Monocercomonoides exilis]|uniref:putative Alpha-soluble NSF attachment protein n=1 Tax=Monocercomonoides exilis TaxID=2049356 RepID=UPI003559B662|nr:putative Alpha-soluble NSF attachment protein [Monocercomonoides exilis]|eukprot:MONOS_8693.1-p1 / transcript=MONOS_8693.1 / gene=MONOS_8693 / organism=Monocercomonoides_exilis_PA203 / gene_product=Alpha-soluble NSF attachment protein / transcript_product=Alpha-soluble NSF attachment protein / location=Mono_scaffold00334:60216-61395(+) / protein_length=287 / sequence_SO=supercontig / SO=protein_coding / is_pseudo=false
MTSATPQELEQKADKKMGTWLGKQSAYDEAGELYSTAANKYKIQRMFVESGKAFEKAADSFQKCGRTLYDIAQQYLEAAKAYKSVSFDDYLRCQEKAIAIEIEDSKIRQSALHLKQTAEACEGAGDFDRAIEHYTRSCDFYQLEGQKSSVQSCQTKLATIYSLHKKNYQKADELFDSLGRSYLETSLTRFSAKECWFKACICRLMAKDGEAVREKLRSYEEADPNLTGTFEKKLIESLCEAVDEADEEKFSSAVANYDSVHRLEPWKTQMLLRLKDDLHKDDENPDL